MDEQRIFSEHLNEHHGFFYTVSRTLYRGRSRYQEIEVIETPEYGVVLLLDSITQVAEKGDWQYHEPMVHYPLLAHDSPHQVLVIGGGDGGTLREVLKHPVSEVDFVELDEEVVNLCREHLGAVHQGAFDDPRVSLHFQDGREWVESHPRRYDAVVMDMTDPFGPSRMLYTREFFRLVSDCLRDENGVFAMHTESPVARPVTFRCIAKTLSSVFPIVRHAYMYIQMYATYWSIAVSSRSTDIASLSCRDVHRRLAERSIAGLGLIDERAWGALQVELPYVRRLPDAVPVITDEHPQFPDRFAGAGV